MPRLSEAENQTSDRPAELDPRLAHLGVVRELMMVMEAVTYAGQHHVMHRALEILRRDIARAEMPPTDDRTTTVYCAMRDLELEAKRMAPRPSAFHEGVNVVLEILYEIWNQRSLSDRQV